MIELSATLDAIDGSQYYAGHGHAFESEEFLGCIFFAVPLQKVDSGEELLDLIMQELNEWNAEPGAEEELSAIPDEDIIKALKETDLEGYAGTLTQITEDIEQELKGEDPADWDNDTYLYGWIHAHREDP